MTVQGRDDRAHLESDGHGRLPARPAGDQAVRILSIQSALWTAGRYVLRFAAMAIAAANAGTCRWRAVPPAGECRLTPQDRARRASRAHGYATNPWIMGRLTAGLAREPAGSRVPSRTRGMPAWRGRVAAGAATAVNSHGAGARGDGRRIPAATCLFGAPVAPSRSGRTLPRGPVPPSSLDQCLLSVRSCSSESRRPRRAATGRNVRALSPFYVGDSPIAARTLRPRGMPGKGPRRRGDGGR